MQKKIELCLCTQVMEPEFFEQPAACSRSSITGKDGPGGMI